MFVAKVHDLLLAEGMLEKISPAGLSPPQLHEGRYRETIAVGHLYEKLCHQRTRSEALVARIPGHRGNGVD
jgi:hypothetical protein